MLGCLYLVWMFFRGLNIGVVELKRTFFILLISQIFSCYGLNFFWPLPTLKFVIWYGCYLGVSYWCSRVKLEKVLLFKKKCLPVLDLKFTHVTISIYWLHLNYMTQLIGELRCRVTTLWLCPVTKWTRHIVLPLSVRPYLLTYLLTYVTLWLNFWFRSIYCKVHML